MDQKKVTKFKTKKKYINVKKKKIVYRLRAKRGFRLTLETQFSSN